MKTNITDQETELQADYKISRGIEWFSVDWNKLNLNTDTLKVYGHLHTHPKVGETLSCEMENSFMKFEFVDVKSCIDPPDMFFGAVKAIEQVAK